MLHFLFSSVFVGIEHISFLLNFYRACFYAFIQFNCFRKAVICSVTLDFSSRKTSFFGGCCPADFVLQFGAIGNQFIHFAL